MTEGEWLACAEPAPMLEFLEDRGVERKLRLLACAIVRHAPFTPKGRTIWDLLPDYDWFASPRSDCHRVIETAERHADGSASAEEWEEAREHLYYVELGTDPDFFDDDPGRRPGLWLGYSVALAVRHTVSYTTPEDRHFLARYMIDYLESIKRYADYRPHPKFERRVCRLIRDVVGNPFRVLGEAADRPSPELVAIAHDIYERRAFDRMPVLGERLEAAGCDDPDILSHCRSQSLHVRGCWVLDLLLSESS
jgi:hypothetical protein